MYLIAQKTVIYQLIEVVEWKTKMAVQWGGKKRVYT
jgi:hypothetical protein